MTIHDKIFIAGDSSPVAKDIYALLKEKGYNNIETCNTKTLNLEDSVRVDAWFQEHRPDIVFLVAARTATEKDHNQAPWQIFQTNLNIQTNVFRACDRYDVKKLVYFSSDSALPWSECEERVNESCLMDSQLKPSIESYALAKLVGIKQCEYLNREKQKSVCTALLPCYIYGNYNRGLVYSIVEDMITAKREGLEKVIMWGTPELKYNFIHTEDLARAAILVAEEDFTEDAFIVAPQEPITKENLAHLIATAIGYEGEIVFNGAANVRHSVLADSSRLYQKGWKPQVAMEEGVARIVEWTIRRRDDSNTD